MDEILAYFGQRRGPAQQKYRSYVAEGISGATIWENLEAQSLLGLEGFAEALRGHVTGKQKVREIPKGQRLIGRPSLDKLFEGAWEEENSRGIEQISRCGQTNHGYSQIEVARHLKLHYSTVSRLIKGIDKDRGSRPG